MGDNMDGRNAVEKFNEFWETILDLGYVNAGHRRGDAFELFQDVGVQRNARIGCLLFECLEQFGWQIQVHDRYIRPSASSA